MVSESLGLRQFINFLQTRGSQVVEAVDRGFVDDLYEKSRKTRRGRPPVYKASQKLKAWVYA